MYKYAAQWYAKRGMVLYASGLQTNMASGAWAWMEANCYPIKFEKVPKNPFNEDGQIRKYLDYR